MPRKRKPNRSKSGNNDMAKQSMPTMPPFEGMAKTGKKSDAEIWESRQEMVLSMYDTLMVQDGGRELDSLNTSMFKGMKAMMDGDFDEAHRVVELMVREFLDPYAFAISDIDEKRGVYRRVYSSHPVEMPLTGDMPMPTDGPWLETMVKQRSMIADNNLTGNAAYYPDSAEGLALGCQCICYLPIPGNNPLFKDDADEGLLGVLVMLAKKEYFNSENTWELATKLYFFWIYMDTLRLAKTYGRTVTESGISRMVKDLL